MDKNRVILSFLIFAGIVTMEWFLSWAIWLQLEWWTIAKSETWAQFTFLLIATTLFGISLVVFIKTRGNKKIVEVEKGGKKPKSEQSFDDIEEKRISLFLEENNNVPTKPLESKLVGSTTSLNEDIDEERAKKVVKVARLKKIAEMISSGKLEVVPTSEDYKELGLTSVIPMQGDTIIEKKPSKKVQSPTENIELTEEELKKLRVEEELP